VRRNLCFKMDRAVAVGGGGRGRDFPSEGECGREG
jgi:hypothetical protein